MPGREVILATGEFYHVFNRGVASQPIIATKRNSFHFLEQMFCYQNVNTPTKYSLFKTLDKDAQEQIRTRLNQEANFLVDLVSYCLMPNHFHLLLKQNQDNGISRYLSLLTNSYTRYFNTKTERKGVLFQGKFKAVRITSNEQLLHVNRYIHLNPYSGYVVKTLKELEQYPFSSLAKYLQPTSIKHCQSKIVMDQFKSRKSYRQFVFDQADYQKQLQWFKHLNLE